MTNETAHDIAEYSRILTQMLSDVIEHNYLVDLPAYQLTKTQFSILKILNVSGPYLVSEIADIMQISRAAASKNVDKLVNYKLVSRKIIARDRRTASISLLKAGERIVYDYEHLRAKKQNAALNDFSVNEQKQLAKLLGKYVRHCLDQEDEINLICLQCNGTIAKNCKLSNHKDRCRFFL